MSLGSRVDTKTSLPEEGNLPEDLAAPPDPMVLAEWDFAFDRC